MNNHPETYQCPKKERTTLQYHVAHQLIASGREPINNPRFKSKENKTRKIIALRYCSRMAGRDLHQPAHTRVSESACFQGLQPSYGQGNVITGLPGGLDQLIQIIGWQQEARSLPGKGASKEEKPKNIDREKVCVCYQANSGRTHPGYF